MLGLIGCSLEEKFPNELSLNSNLGAEFFNFSMFILILNSHHLIYHRSKKISVAILFV